MEFDDIKYRGNFKFFWIWFIINLIVYINLEKKFFESKRIYWSLDGCYLIYISRWIEVFFVFINLVYIFFW